MTSCECSNVRNVLCMHHSVSGPSVLFVAVVYKLLFCAIVKLLYMTGLWNECKKYFLVIGNVG